MTKHTTNSIFLEIQADVQEAIAANRPVVALESTLISHGLPWPDNLETATACEDAVRNAGALPATISIIHGVVHVGTSKIVLERLARNASGDIQKASRRDIPAIVAAKAWAATTVSATAFIARLAGIAFMATGGIGGVHRGAGESFDISCDLAELGRAGQPMALVCSGVKSILDIPATLEKLETLGVPVIGYGTRQFPAFTEYSSGLTLDHSVNDPQQAASFFAAHVAFSLPSMLLFAQPCSRELSLNEDLAEKARVQAFAEAAAKGISGKAITPFLLGRISELTLGQSLRVNKQLIINNAATAGQI
ncbi:MAG: pseudouridine-5'-phosphate glycosidase, partial [Isosphaeraceae bacterium]